MNKPVIGIVDRPGSFSDRWLRYSKDAGFAITIVDPFANDIIDQLRNIDGLMWHVAHFSPCEQWIANHILYSCQKLGIPSFPSLDTIWTFDDKVAQKYVLESIDCPLVPTEVFFDESTARDWAARVTYPKVFKLRCGAGSRNVRLIRSQQEANNAIRKSFRYGYAVSSGNVSDAVGKFRSGKSGLGEIVKKLLRMPKTLAKIHRLNRLASREIGYVYFQEFMPGNTHDTRVTVVGDRAFAFRRKVRHNDFRASGSGSIDNEQNRINKACISIAFDLARNLHAQSLCIDFVEDQDQRPFVVEVSYVYVAEAVKAIGGYWTPELEYREGSIWPQDAILDDFLESLKQIS